MIKSVTEATLTARASPLAHISETAAKKGIADTLPEVNTELKYTIDDSVKTGTNLPVKIYNQYVDGEAVDMWCTNLNPQDDIWSKYIAAESDI